MPAAGRFATCRTKLLAGMEMYDSVLDMSELSRTFGIEPTPLEVVVGQMFGGVGS